MIESGKIPPQAIELEEAVLGAILLEPQSMIRVADTLRAALFYKESHRIIYRALHHLYYNDTTPDMLIVTESLKSKGQLDLIGGPYAIVQLTQRVSSSANIEYHTRILEEKYINRKLIEIGDKMMASGYDDSDALENMDAAQNLLAEILVNRSDSVKNMEQLSRELLDHLTAISENENQITGIPTGLSEYDNRAGGLHSGDLAVIAGETSNGKTALGMNIAFNAAREKYKVGIWSLEMHSLELTIRAYSQRTGINNTKMQLHPLSDDEMGHINSVVDEMIEQKLYIDDEASSDYKKLKLNIKSAVLKKGLQLVVVDYLQLIRHSDFKINKHEMFAEIANDLKRLAKQLKIPIILISQLSRDKLHPKPSLNRLKGSGDIENAADVVWLTWLPEKYQMDTFDLNDGTRYDSTGRGHQIIAKARKGGIFDFPVMFDGKTTSFSDNKETASWVEETPEYDRRY